MLAPLFFCSINIFSVAMLNAFVSSNSTKEWNSILSNLAKTSIFYVILLSQDTAPLFLKTWAELNRFKILTSDKKEGTLPSEKILESTA